MRSYIIFNGKSSEEFGITIEQLPESSHAERRGTPYQIAGRNGSFVYEDGTFENYEQVYAFNTRNIATERDAYQTARDIAEWLLGSSGFCRLEDTYEPEHFRFARFAGPFNVESILRRFGRGTMVFECHPERYLKSGEKWITAFENVHAVQAASYILTNPTQQTAKPIIRVTGQGSVQFAITPVNGEDVAILTSLGSAETTITIDCENYDVRYADGTDASGIVQFVDTDGYPEFPRLAPGDNNVHSIQFNGSGLIKSLEVMPRWWSI